jgi:hypothetical protein
VVPTHVTARGPRIAPTQAETREPIVQSLSRVLDYLREATDRPINLVNRVDPITRPEVNRVDPITRPSNA